MDYINDKKSSQQCNRLKSFFYLNGIPLIWLCDKINQTYFLIICFIEFIICSAPVKKVKVFLRDLTPKEISQMRRPKTSTSTTTWSFFVPSIRRAIFINSIVEAEGKTNYTVLTDDLRTQRVVLYPEWKNWRNGGVLRMVAVEYDRCLLGFCSGLEYTLYSNKLHTLFDDY